MSVISHGGEDYGIPTANVQDDASATSLDATKVPTGQTIDSVLNSNFVRIGKVTGDLTVNQYNLVAYTNLLAGKTYKHILAVFPSNANYMVALSGMAYGKAFSVSGTTPTVLSNGTVIEVNVIYTY